MFKDVDKLHERYLTGEHGDKTDDIDVLQTVALKSECNPTVGQFCGCHKFALQNSWFKPIYSIQKGAQC